MSRAWIIDVLADLQSFARRNDLPRLAAHLDETQRLAADELMRRPMPAPRRGPAALATPLPEGDR